MAEFRPLLVSLLRDAALEGVRAYVRAHHEHADDAPPLQATLIDAPGRDTGAPYREIALFLASAHRYARRAKLHPTEAHRNGRMAAKRLREALLAAASLPVSAERSTILRDLRDLARLAESESAESPRLQTRAALAERIDALTERCLDLD